MAREEREIYNLEEGGGQEEGGDLAPEEEEMENHVMYHNFYGY